MTVQGRVGQKPHIREHMVTGNQTTASHSLTMPLLMELRGVTKHYGGVTALDSVDFELCAGEVHGLIGENGAGKSTMMKLLSGVYNDYSGEMRLHGEVVRFSSPADAQARGIGMVYQELSAFKHLTVAENIFGRNPPLRNGLIDWRSMNRTAQEHINKLGLDIDVTQIMGQLPVGYQQLIEIARVIFSGAQIIILDEPTSALSPPETRRLFDFIATLQTHGKTIIFISHFLEDVLEVTDRITVLKNNRKIAILNTKETNKHQLVEMMIGADAKLLKQMYSEEAGVRRHERRAVDQVALVVDQLTKQHVFNQVSFEIGRGEILGLFGFMGAGQIQLARCLFGAELVDSGAIMLYGQKLHLKNTTQARAAGVAYVPENRRDSLMLKQEVYKNITLAHLHHLRRWLLNQHAELAVAKEQIKNLGIRPPKPLLPVGALSGGNQQKVVLAKWLVRQPRLLILNEPTRGMDVGAKDEVITIVKTLCEHGVAVLLITSEPETILSIANRAMVISKGRITAEVSGGQLTKENLVKHA